MSDATRPNYRSWLRGVLVFLALLTLARFVLEVAGVPHAVTRYISSSAGTFLAAIYLGTIAHLRGVTRLVQLVPPAVMVAAWSGGWVILATVVSAVFRLERSHFAEPEDYGDWGHVGSHVGGHVVEIAIFASVVLILMAVPFLLRRWPITVGPGALLGGLVIVRYWVEALGADPARAAAWSSTVGILLCGFYLGGVGRRFELDSGGRLLLPSLVLSLTWRFWTFLAAVLSAAFPFYRTHFFDPSEGRTFVRLAQLLGGSLAAGFVVGLVVWGIAVWISRATRPAAGSA